MTLVLSMACNLLPASFMKMNVSRTEATGQPLPRFPEATTIAKLVGVGVTGLLSIFAAIITTVVESGGFWQQFWLGACILFFVCAISFVIFATKDGLRIDHTGLSFEPHDNHQ